MPWTKDSRHTEETKRKISESHKGRSHVYQQGTPLSDEHKAKISAGNKGTKTQARSDAAKLRWSKMNKKARRKQIEAATAANTGSSPTSIEIKTAKFLDALGIEYEQQKHYSRFRLDFWIAPDLIVECDGDYWHSLPEARVRDASLDRLTNARFHRIVHLTETDINNNNFNALLEVL